MYDTVECPYCGKENDMSDALCNGLSDDNKLDWTCEHCEEEFEVYVEFEPTFTASKIEYVECGVCGAKTRDIYDDKRIFPFPEKLKGKKVCHKCWLNEISKEINKEN